jgi:hypothetical protein
VYQSTIPRRPFNVFSHTDFTGTANCSSGGCTNVNSANYPGPNQTHPFRAWLLLVIHRIWERASRLQSSDLTTLDLLGKAYMRAESYKDAADLFARLMTINPDAAEAHVMMGMTYTRCHAMENHAPSMKPLAKPTRTIPAFIPG